jgi:putative ABC transport system substrate-binding protein
MERRVFLRVITGGLLAAPLAAEAQQAEKVVRIGYLASNLASNPLGQAAFLQGLRELGYVEGHNIVIEYRDAKGQLERLTTLAAELAALKVDVIVAASGTLPALAARRASQDLPVVFIAVGDPITSGLAKSLARPGGNATGLSAVSPDLSSKWMQLLRETVPGVRRIAVLWQPGGMGERTDKDVLNGMHAAARALGMQIQLVEARRPADIDRAFSEIGKARVGALAVVSTPMFGSERVRVVGLAASNQLPAVYGYRSYVDDGGLMSYGPHLEDLSRRAASYVDRIVQGARPGDLPVEQPTRYELAINLKTAKALGLTIPPSALSRADQVIDP